MRTILSLTSVVGLCVVSAAAPSIAWDFSATPLGELPKGWTEARTGQGEGSVWRVVEDPAPPSGTKVLAQTAAGPSHLFNLCLLDGSSFQNVDLSVVFKAVQGKSDQGGGLVWRCRDADNYYVARMNPLEDNYRLYKVVQGKRTQLIGQNGVKVPAGEWHLLRVVMQGDRITCWLDEKKLLEATDSTFPEAGQVGLWTKADAQTYFDDFEVQEVR